MTLPEWASFLGLVARLYERHADRLKAAKEFGDFRYESGAVAAYEEMANVADQVALKLEELHDRTIRTEHQRRTAESVKSDALRYSHWNPPD